MKSHISVQNLNMAEKAGMILLFWEQRFHELVV